MMALPLDVALSVLTIAMSLMALQLVIVTVELARLRRDTLLLLRTVTALNYAVNPWAGEEEPTSPGFKHPAHTPPRVRRPARWAMWLPAMGKRHRDAKRPPPRD